MPIRTDRHVILGTAGHIDHGKSALVKALTGTDPDRLKEEKERGITIDLGFAELAFDDGLTLGIVDVPGHERLIRNMLAGAGGIDIVAMIIAADEGVMPQSREHLAICDLLGIERGVIVLTKTDLVESDWIELVMDDVGKFVKGTFLEDAEIIPVSSVTGRNLDRLKQHIHDLAFEVPVKSENGIFRLPVDRVFTLKGFGTVVTGTSLSGTLSVEEPVEILPSGLKSRVRGLQRHGKPVNRARAGQRIAVNLQGIEKEELSRGDIITVPERLAATVALDAHVKLLHDAPSIKSRARVHLHIGTADTVARLILYDTEVLRPGKDCFCQLRLEQPVVAMSGDRFVIRRFSPLATVGGGTVLDPTPRRRRRAEGLADLETINSGGLEDSLQVKIMKEGVYGLHIKRIEGWIKADLRDIAASIESLVKKGGVIKVGDFLLHSGALEAFRERILSELKIFHKNNPMKAGMPKEELRAVIPGLSPRLFAGLLAAVREAVVEKDLVRSAGFKVALSEDRETGRKQVLEYLDKGGFQPPFLKEISASLKMPEREVADLLRLLARNDSAKRINDSLYMSDKSYNEMLEKLRGFFREKPDMTVAEFRDLIGTTRKYALPILEHLDSARVTLRKGDVRKFLLK